MSSLKNTSGTHAVTRRTTLAALPALCASLFPMAATAQAAYPTGQVRIMSPFEAGGSTDVLARILQRKFSEVWKDQPVVVENKVGAGGNIGADSVAKARPDGHSLLVVASNYAINPALYKNMPFDARRDLAPTALIGKAANVIVVHPALPITNVKELIAYAKANPGMNYASGGSGAGSHIIAEMFKHAAGVNMTHVPYKGSAPALTGLLRGDVAVYFSNMVAVIPHARSGKLRVIAVTSATRNRALPDAPTVAESGIPGFEADNWYGVLTTGKSPPAAIRAVNAAVQRALQDPQVIEQLVALGITPEPISAEQFTAFVDAELVKWRDAVELAGAKVD